MVSGKKTQNTSITSTENNNNQKEQSQSEKFSTSEPIGTLSSSVAMYLLPRVTLSSLPPEATPPSINQADNTSLQTLQDRERRNAFRSSSLL
ncbi:hypothetical protein TNCV_2994651 [Trichonephila clavipes]|nr:hypothetical protein TNCV_2994651 [Trichonephila clavipes]